MGAYLSEPVTEKVSVDKKLDRLAYGASSMQGWRVSQEDAHNCIAKFDDNTALFAVYDGHGGAEVAQYCSLYLPDYIKSTSAYKAGNMGQALEDAMLGFDATLVQPDVQLELKQISGIVEQQSDTEENEVDYLCQEAHMPLEELLSKYKSGCGIIPGIQRLTGDKNKPNSPYLRAKRVQSGACSSRNLLKNSTKAFGDGVDEDVDEEAEEEKDGVTESNATITHENEVQKVKELTAAEGCKKTSAKSDGQESDCATAEAISDKLVNGEEANSKSDAARLVQIGTDKKKEDDADLDSPNLDSMPANGIESSCEMELVGGADEVGKVGKGKGKGKKSVELAPSSKSAACSPGKDQASCSKGCPVLPIRKGKHREARPQLMEDSSDNSEETDDDPDEEYEDTNSESDDDDDDDGENEEDEEDSDEDDDDDTGFQISEKEEPGYDSGCTAVVAILRGNELVVANAGDSRCVVCRSGNSIEMSHDHKPEDDVERLRIVAAGGKVTADGRVNGGLNLSRAIGDHSYKNNTNLPAKEQMISALPDIRTLTVDPAEDEFMVVACDGIWNYMNSQDVVNFVRERISKSKQLSSICEELFDHCLAPNTAGDGTGCDNMTAVIVKFGNSQSASTNAGGVKRDRTCERDEETNSSVKKPKLDDTQD